MGALTVARDLLEFSFESTVAANLPEAALLRLVRQASATNERLGLTGRLRLDGRRFTEVLEGSSATLLPLAGRILADSRHGSIRVTAFGAISGRRFADWAVEGFDGTAALDPGGIVHFLPMPRPESRSDVPAAVLRLAGRAPATARPDA